MTNAVANIVLATLLVGSLVSCATPPTQRTAVDAPTGEEPPSDFKTGLALLTEQKFQEAHDAFRAHLNNEPTSPWTRSAQLNLARALEGLGRWTEAGQLYREIATSTASAPKIQALALYRSSFVHDALGNDQQAVAVLHDLLNRRQHLPQEVATAELPARLAAAYAKVGNFEKAAELYQSAESGISQLRRGTRETPEWLPRTLYTMGRIPSQRVSWADFEVTLRPLARAQAYLLQAAELDAEPWSEHAATELMSVYRDLWTSIEKAPFPESSDPLVSQRQRQESQWDRATLVLENLRGLRAKALPGATSAASPPAREILDYVKALETKIVALLDQRPAGEGITPEAEARRQVVRGRVISPDSTLERLYRQTKPRLPGTTSLPDRTDETSVQDPNL